MLALGFMFFGPRIMKYMAEENPLNIELPTLEESKTYKAAYTVAYNQLLANDSSKSVNYLTFYGASTLDMLIADRYERFVFSADHLCKFNRFNDDTTRNAAINAHFDFLVDHLNLPIEQLQREADSLDRHYETDKWVALVADSLLRFRNSLLLLNVAPDSLTARYAPATPFEIKLEMYGPNRMRTAEEKKALKARAIDAITTPVSQFEAYWDSTKSDFPFTKYPAYIHRLKP